MNTNSIVIKKCYGSWQGKGTTSCRARGLCVGVKSGLNSEGPDYLTQKRTRPELKDQRNDGSDGREYAEDMLNKQEFTG